MYYVYIVRCTDDTLYTGIATDVERRITEHNSSIKGAKYTQGRRPVVLLFAKPFKNRSLASKEESRLKKLSKIQKMQWCLDA